MARRTPHASEAVAGLIVEAPESSILDLLDRLLDKGAVLDGDVTLGLAGVDLIYLRLAAVLGAADRLLPHGSRGRLTPAPARRRRR